MPSIQSAIALLRSARIAFEAQFGPAEISISVSIRDGVGKRLAYGLPLEKLDSEPATTMEANILETLANGQVALGVLAERAGYPLNSRFRTVLARMRRAGLIDSDNGVYWLTEDPDGPAMP